MRDLEAIKKSRLDTAIRDIRSVGRQLIQQAEEIEEAGLSSLTSGLVLSLGHRATQAACEFARLEGVK